jgi:putative SOS response-associated peptidase YedK
MCGRFTLRAPESRLKSDFEVEELPPVEARYNIAPTQNVLAIHETSGSRQVKLLRWGLIPSWAKDAAMGSRLINARSETVTEKPAFREAFKHRRCLIPADGFYEWQPVTNRKQPYFFRLKDDRPFAFAGLWESWKGASGERVESCSILTTEANELLRGVHDRMPLILHPEDYELWLDDDARKREMLKELLRPYAASEMVAHPVGALINNPKSQGAELIKEVGASLA